MMRILFWYGRKSTAMTSTTILNAVALRPAYFLLVVYAPHAIAK